MNISKRIRLTEDDVAFQLQFMEEQEHQGSMDGDSEDNNNKTDDHEYTGEEENPLPKRKNKRKEVELSSEERVLMFKVNSSYQLIFFVLSWLYLFYIDK